MRILTFTDLHLSDSALTRIKWKSKIFNPDLLVCAGDITVFESGLDEMLKKINDLGKKTLIIHGNHEDASLFKKKCEKYENLTFIHKKYHIEGDYIFFGYGGGGFAINDLGFNSTQKKFEKAIKKNKKKKKIFVTHGPPHGTKQDYILDHHAGNKNTKNFSIKNKINLHICGHLHENFGVKDKIKETKFLNPGPYGKLVFI